MGLRGVARTGKSGGKKRKNKNKSKKRIGPSGPDLVTLTGAKSAKALFKKVDTDGSGERAFAVDTPSIWAIHP